jgi:hypothetical protein
MIVLDFGDGARVYRKPEPLAVEWEHRVLMDAIELLHEIRAAGTLPADSFQATIPKLFFAIGAIYERIRIRPWEPLVAAETRRRRGAAKGGRKSRKLTTSQEEVLRQFIIDAKRGGVSDSAACVRAVGRLCKECGVKVSAKTAATYLPGRVGKQ